MKKPKLKKRVVLTAVGVLVLVAPVMAGLMTSAVPQAGLEKFDVVSIRPSAPGEGLGGNIIAPSGTGWAWVDVCGYPGPRPWELRNGQLTRNRLTLNGVTLYRLVTLAYGKHCRAALALGLLTGAPDWGHSQKFDLQAVMPAGTPAYTLQDLQFGAAPELQAMLQNMLKERFRLTLHRTEKDAPLYNLVLVRRDEKIKASEDQTPLDSDTLALSAGPPAPTAPTPRGSFLIGVNPPDGTVTLKAVAVPIATIVNIFQGQEGRMVIDKTGLKGLYDIPEVTLNVGPFDINGSSASVWPEVMKQLGLKLEPARGPLEVLAIDRVERPSEN